MGKAGNPWGFCPSGSAWEEGLRESDRRVTVYYGSLNSAQEPVFP